MQIHSLKRKTKNRDKKRIGRGGKRGTYSGRGIKGQKARAGRRIRPEIRDLIKKLPKKRGYRFATFQEKPAPINIEVLAKHFTVGEEVSPKTLLEKKLLRSISGRKPLVKILGKGELTQKISVRGCLVSQSAKEKIEKAGGDIK